MNISCAGDTWYGMERNGVQIMSFFTRVSMMACLYILNSRGFFSGKIYGVSILTWRVSVPSIAEKRFVRGNHRIYCYRGLGCGSSRLSFFKRGATYLFFVPIH